MNQYDNEYKLALRYCLERAFLKNVVPTDPISIDLNVVKPLINYIRTLTPNPEDFIFSKPVYAWWDLTSACNFRCIHCLYNDRDYSDKNDLSTQEAFRLAEELVNDMGISCINLTGGEIFLRKDTLDIIEIFKKNNVAVRLATNASLLDDQKISKLADLFNPYTDMVQISLDGATSETFKKIRRTDTFDKIISNIKKLTNSGVTVNVAYTVNNINNKEVFDAYKLCNELGVKTFFVGKLICYNESHKKLALPNRDLVVLSSKIKNMDCTDYKTEFRSSFFSVLELLNLPYASEILREQPFVEYFKKNNKSMEKECSFHDRLSIRSDGRIYMCMQAESCPDSLLGNFRENSLSEIWEKRFDNVLFKKRQMKDTNCSTCFYGGVCNSGCKAISLQKFNNQNLPEINCKYFYNPE